MGLLDEQITKALEGNFGRRLDAATNATDNLRKSVESLERAVAELTTELRRRPG